MANVTFTVTYVTPLKGCVTSCHATRRDMSRYVPHVTLFHSEANATHEINRSTCRGAA